MAIATTPPPAPEGGTPEPKQGGEQEGTGRKPGPDRDQAIDRKFRNMEKRLKAYEDADNQRKESAMSESEKLQARAKKAEEERDQLRAQNKKQLIQSEFEAAAREAGAVNPRAAFKLAELAGVDVDDSGTVSGVKEALEAMKSNTELAFLFSKSVPPGTPLLPSGGNPAGGNPATLTAESIYRMTPDERAKLREEVRTGAKTL